MSKTKISAGTNCIFQHILTSLSKYLVFQNVEHSVSKFVSSFCLPHSINNCCIFMKKADMWKPKHNL